MLRPAAALLALLLAAGCLAAPVEEGPTLVLGSTTSTQDSGLLDALLPAYEAASGVRVRAVVGGTGEVVEKARRGDVDVLLTHSPQREEALVAAGDALSRREVMSNRFALVGAEGDPADVAGASSAAEALRRVHDDGSLFASRGDRSGTHDKELSLWRAAGLDPATFPPAWYKETGAGQAQTLLYAAERGAYALTDEATLAQLQGQGRAESLRVLFGDDPALRNQYAVTLLNATRLPSVHAGLATAFADWLTGPEGQAAIAAYRVGGRQVFTPDARGGAG